MLYTTHVYAVLFFMLFA